MKNEGRYKTHLQSPTSIFQKTDELLQKALDRTRLYEAREKSEKLTKDMSDDELLTFKRKRPSNLILSSQVISDEKDKALVRVSS